MVKLNELNGKEICKSIYHTAKQEAFRYDETSSQKSNLGFIYITMSIDCFLKPSVMRLQNPRDFWNKLKHSY